MELTTSSPKITWLWCEFSQLTTKQLYDLLQLRQRIFVLEQNCLYADIDGEDIHHHHLLAYEKEHLVGCLRVIPPRYHPRDSVAIGRVAVSEVHRGSGIARKMMLQGLDYCHQRYPSKKVFVSAQRYLQSFYQSLGFVTISDVYLEDDIPHIAMEKVFL